MGWGWNPLEVPGGALGDGGTGRITDPVTGAGLFNPNMDPAVSGIDPLTGVEAPTGTDMSFGAMVRRQIHTNVINGDFAVTPPSGAYSTGDTSPYWIVSDPNDARYNPLPGWTVTLDSNGNHSAYIVADAGYGSGYRLAVASGALAVSTTTDASQLIPVPTSQGQQYRVLPSVYVTGGSVTLGWQFYESDGTTAIGSEVTQTRASSGELKVDAGLVPTTAAYIRLRVSFSTTLALSTCGVAEVRCAFLPAEATLGLSARTSATGAITTTETVAASLTIPAGTFTVGSTYRLTCHGLITSSAANSVTFRMRVGTTTLTGNVAMSRALTATTTASSNGFSISGLFTVRSVGASGACLGNVMIVGSATQPFSVNAASSETTATVAVDTTVANVLEFTVVTAAGTTSVNVTQATWECVMAS